MTSTTSIITSYPVIMPDKTQKHRLVCLNNKKKTQGLPFPLFDTTFKAAEAGLSYIRSGNVEKPAVFIFPKTYVYSVKYADGLFTATKGLLEDGRLQTLYKGTPKRNFNEAASDSLMAIEASMFQEPNKFISNYYISESILLENPTRKLKK